jgi:hypothetical protein
MRQRDFFERHARAAATGGTEQEQRDYAAQRAQIQADHLQAALKNNARIFEQYDMDYREWLLHSPDNLSNGERAAPKCAGCGERHSILRLRCRMAPSGRRDLPFTSGTASPPRTASRVAVRLAVHSEQPPRHALMKFEVAARASICSVGRLVRTGAQPTDYAGGALEAPQRYNAATPAATPRE